MAGVDGAQPVGELKQRLEQKVVLHARQRIDRIEAVADQRGDDGFGRRHRLCRLGGLGLPLHVSFPGVECADRRKPVEAVGGRRAGTGAAGPA